MSSESFYCEKCDYNAKRKSDFKKHLKTKKHNSEKKDKLNCVCGKRYKYPSSLYKHKKKCEHHSKKNIENVSTSNSNKGLPKGFNEIFKSSCFGNAQNNDTTKDNRNMLIEGSIQYQNMQHGVQNFIDKICTNDKKKNDDHAENTEHLNIFDMVCTIENLDIPYSYYEYSMDDPDIKELYNRISATINSSFDIKDKKIVINRGKMTRDDVDKHNLSVVNNLLFIAQEQQCILEKTIIEPYMYIESDDVKLNYYKKVVKMIIFLYGDEIQEITEMLIDSLQMHNRNNTEE